MVEYNRIGDGAVLVENDASVFATWSFNCAREKSARLFGFSPHKALNFSEMSNLRQNRSDVGDFQRDLDFPQGRIVANIGVSAVLTTRIEDSEYFMLVRQQRNTGGFSDDVAKLLSGYVQIPYATNEDITLGTLALAPLRGILQEIAEELLFVNSTGEVLLGVTGSGKALEKPYAASVKYANEKKQFALRVDESYVPAGLSRNVFAISQNLTLKPIPGRTLTQLSSETNSAQVIYSFRIELPEGGSLTGYHVEDTQNSASGKLEATVKEKGLLFVPLRNGEMATEVYTLEKGKLVPLPNEYLPQGGVRDLLLSEAFVPHDRGVVSRNNIRLEEYLNRTRDFSPVQARD